VSAVEFLDVVKRLRRRAHRSTRAHRCLVDCRPRRDRRRARPVRMWEVDAVTSRRGGLEEPSAGRVLVGGNDLATMDAVWREPSCAAGMWGMSSSASTLVAWADRAGERDAAARARRHERARGSAMRAREVLALWRGLEHHLDRYPDDFSGESNSAIAIARAIRRCPLVGAGRNESRPGRSTHGPAEV